MQDTDAIAPTGRDGGNPPVPTRGQRKQCHARRDAFFACLDANGIESPERAADGAECAALRSAMHEVCLESWATYFEKLRMMQIQKARIFGSDGTFVKRQPPSKEAAGPDKK
ncbi:hypothetical protein GGI11_007498 [Coemansia sp. RSA 2049]|nr:hypothetical protein GGI11_007498 [Coemansia sp. RSA 2049]KAJ2590924.1 hypothetical protein EV177_008969 [Coemansia sp. RSA 1804]KAJ2682022.1 hypothetical protein GGH99_004923 [Coemansia sp. RSA 1285]